MKLSELFRGTTTQGTGAGEATKGTGSSTSGEVVISQKNLNMLKLNRQIKSLAPGHTLQGEVISKKGSEVQIKLADDLVLSARLERELSMDIGKILTFEVRNNGKALTLSPLFANTATDANVLKALDMANIPANDVSVEMTQTMMEQGMSVDKNNLQSVYRDVTAHMDASLRDIVQLHQLGVEVTPESLAQLSNYHSFNHQMTEGMNQIISDLNAHIESMVQAGKSEEALMLMAKLSSVFGEQASGVGVGNSSMDGVLINENIAAQNGGTASINGSASALANATSAETAMTGGTVSAQDIINALFSGSDGETLKSTLQQYAQVENDVTLQNLLSQMENGKATISDVMEHLGTKTFLDALKGKMQGSWLLEPEAIQDKENVDKLYNRIQKQLSEMSKHLADMPGAETSSAMKSVTNMQNNLDFMNQINQTFAFVQLPLQMSGKEAHGELYVYTNKRNLAREDGSVSAFLHLDMENLGPVDVYVAMQNQKVNTKFYLKDDEMIDFIQAHIHILNERLAKRGYSMNCEMIAQNTEEETSIIDRITDSDKNVSVLSQYAFDVRA